MRKFSCGGWLERKGEFGSIGHSDEIQEGELAGGDKFMKKVGICNGHSVLSNCHYGVLYLEALMVYMQFLGFSRGREVFDMNPIPNKGKITIITSRI